MKSQGQTLPDLAIPTSVPRRQRWPLEPFPAWVAILGLLLITLIGSLLGLGKVLRLAYPAASLGVAILLYSRYPLMYLGFNWWIWFISPLLRRLADHYSSFDSQSLMLTAPYLVTSVAAMTLIRDLPRAHRQSTLPFVLATLGIIYSFFIAYVNNIALLSIARALLDWLPPVLFGFHLARQWRNYPQIRQNTQRCFIWGLLVMGLYGVYQYMVAPAWDCSWLENVDLTSFGEPEPRKIRVWSTLNSPVAFSATAMAGLLLLFSYAGELRIPAGMAGFLAFLLSRVRAAWGGWVVGMFVLFGSLRSHLQLRLMVTLLVLAVCVTPLTLIEPFSTEIQARLETFTNISEDSSYQARADTYAANIRIALSGALGQGMGGTFKVVDGRAERVALDSGVLEIFFTLGWFGAIPYLGGLLLLILSQFQGDEHRIDRFCAASRSITTSYLASLFLGPFMTGVSGLCLWGFLGLSVAARKYYLSEKFSQFPVGTTEIAPSDLIKP
jgi:hypothetical protein